MHLSKGDDDPPGKCGRRPKGREGTNGGCPFYTRRLEALNVWQPARDATRFKPLSNCQLVKINGMMLSLAVPTTSLSACVIG